MDIPEHDSCVGAVDFTAVCMIQSRAHALVVLVHEGDRMAGPVTPRDVTDAERRRYLTRTVKPSELASAKNEPDFTVDEHANISRVPNA